MKVYVRTAGFHLHNLAGRQVNGWYEVETGEKAQIQDILSVLEVNTEDGITYMLNGNHAADETRLRENDEILLLRMMYGG